MEERKWKTHHNDEDASDETRAASLFTRDNEEQQLGNWKRRNDGPLFAKLANQRHSCK